MVPKNTKRLEESIFVINFPSVEKLMTNIVPIIGNSVINDGWDISFLLKKKIEQRINDIPIHKKVEDSTGLPMQILVRYFK